MASDYDTDIERGQDDDGSNNPPPSPFAPSEEGTSHGLSRRMRQMWSILTRGSTMTSKEEAEEEERVAAIMHYLDDGSLNTRDSRFLKFKNRFLTDKNRKGNKREADRVINKLVREHDVQLMLLGREMEVLERYERALRAVLELLGGVGVNVNAQALHDGDADSGIHM